MLDDSMIRKHFSDQAAACERLGSTFYGRFVAQCGARLGRETAIERLVLGWPGQPRTDALALRFLGLVRYLALEGHTGLQRLYDGDGSVSPSDWRVIQAALVAAGERGMRFLQAPVQTNEVGRCFALQAAFRYLTAESGLPLDLYEVGASAGLNMLWDNWCYDVSGCRWGDRSAPITLHAQWSGNTLAEGRPRVVGRRASDLCPLDVTRVADQLRLLSYVWPDQSERIDRTKLALARFVDSGLIVEAGEAEGWVRANLPASRPGVLRVVYHSIMQQYLTRAEWERFRALLWERGAAATADSPLCWVRLEPCASGAHAELSLVSWPGARAQLLAECDFQGRWLRWLA